MELTNAGSTFCRVQVQPGRFKIIVQLFDWSGPLVLALFVGSQATPLLSADALPDLAKIKLAAEHGDPQAQNTLGDRYRSSFNYSEAAKWYRLAAENGIADAQYQLGKIYLEGRSASGGGVQIRKTPPEGMQWLYKAANQNHSDAQIQLGHCYQGGNEVVKNDLIEAYKWYSLAAKTNPLFGNMYRDPLILKLSSPEIAEGQRRAEAFKGRETPLTVKTISTSLDKVVLQGIAGPKDHRVAVINNRTFVVGEAGQIKIGTNTLHLICHEISDDSVSVGIDGTSERKELSLKGHR